MSQKTVSAVFGPQSLSLGGDVILGADGDPVPQPGLETASYWIVDAWGYLAAQHRGRGRGRTVAWWMGLIGSFALDFTMRLGGRRPYAPLSHITPVPPSAIDDGFDDLWARCRVQMPDTLLSVRDAGALRARLGDDPDTRLLKYEKDGRVAGYVALVRADDGVSGLRAYEIVDVLIDGPNAEVATALLGAAYEYATAKGCHVLAFPGPPAVLAGLMQKHKPYLRVDAGAELRYATADPALHGRLADPAAWYLTALDRRFS